MMQKLEKLIDLAAEALSLYVRKTTAELGGALPLLATEEPAKPRKPRGPNKEKAAPPTEAQSGTVFGAVTEPSAAPSKLNPEDAIEAGRRGQEVMGLFIRRYLKASPTGLERAKKIINDTLGLPRSPAAAWKLEDFTPEDWLKLTPIFEGELDKA